MLGVVEFVAHNLVAEFRIEVSEVHIDNLLQRSRGVDMQRGFASHQSHSRNHRKQAIEVVAMQVRHKDVVDTHRVDTVTHKLRLSRLTTVYKIELLMHIKRMSSLIVFYVGHCSARAEYGNFEFHR